MQTKAFPPGPDTSPAANLFAMRRDPLAFFAKLARDFGDVVRFNTGAIDFYFLNEPELIKSVLVTRDRDFVKWFAVDRTKVLLGEGLFVSEGEWHHRQRKLSQPAFHHQRIAGYAAVMADYSRQLRDRWRDGATLDVAAEMNWLTMVIVAKTLFGADVDAEASEIRDALSAILALFERSTLPPDEAAEFDEARARLDATVLRIIRERRASGEDRGDLLSMLLLARDDDDSGMTDEQLRDEAMTIFLAGHETTANALTWTWYLLTQNPDAETKLHAELDRCLTSREPEAGDIAALTFTRMIFNEALRLYPPVWAVGRRALRDVPLDGFTIPAGSVAIISQFITQRDARWFPDPLRFEPERWRAESIAARPKFSFFPFSAGSRSCLGEGFAWMESALAIATLAQKWRLTLAPGHVAELQPQLTLRPKNGMRMRVVAR